MNAILLFQKSEMGSVLHPFVLSEAEAFCAFCDEVYLICLQPKCTMEPLKRFKNLHVITYTMKQVRRNPAAILKLFTPAGVRDFGVALHHGKLNKRYPVQTGRVLMFGEVLFNRARAVLRQHADQRQKWVVQGYWLVGPAYAAARLKRMDGSIYTFARAHSSEVDIVRNPQCICQMKGFIMKYIDDILFVSDWGRDNFEKYVLPCYPGTRIPPYEVLRLGTLKKGDSVNHGSSDGVIRIVSCSRVVPLKRLNLIAEALRAWDCAQPVEWCHIGDGKLLEDIKSIVSGAGAQVHCSFPGSFTNEEVHDFFVTRPVDIFVNVSEFEGLPVSIMEAQSYGIPVIATDAGGTREIVNEGNGHLLPVACDAEMLLDRLKAMVNRLNDPEQRRAMQSNAMQTWQTLCDKEKNYRVLKDKLDKRLQD